MLGIILLSLKSSKGRIIDSQYASLFCNFKSLSVFLKGTHQLLLVQSDTYLGYPTSMRSNDKHRGKCRPDQGMHCELESWRIPKQICTIHTPRKFLLFSFFVFFGMLGFDFRSSSPPNNRQYRVLSVTSYISMFCGCIVYPIPQLRPHQVQPHTGGPEYSDVKIRAGCSSLNHSRVAPIEPMNFSYITGPAIC
jgi:hypothetical protein